MNSAQFYFSVDNLENLIKLYKTYRSSEPDNNILTGFVFTPGLDENDNPACFAFPLYSGSEQLKKKTETISSPILVQNLTNYKGCPYPPGC